METVFSHRPLAGISVGARSHNGRLYVAFALVNDGTSSNGVFWKERRDNFSRPIARRIINGRIDAAIEERDSNLGSVDIFTPLEFDTDMTARQFIRDLRPLFKPSHDESDDVFCGHGFGLLENIPIRYRLEAKGIVNKLRALIKEAANVSADIRQ